MGAAWTIQAQWRHRRRLWTGCLQSYSRDHLELWVTDGFQSGTSIIANLPASAQIAGDVVVAGDKLFFALDDVATGRELWVYDGNSVFLLQDTNPGGQGSDLNDLMACGDRVYYGADHETLGQELFVSDGTSAGTGLAVDIRPGPSGGYPEGMTLCDGSLLFRAWGADGDEELYQYTLPGAHVLDLGFGTEAHLTATAPVIGSPMTVAVSNMQAGDLGLLLMSNLAAPNATFVSPGNASWMDLASVQLMGASTASTWSSSFAIPASPTFVGMQVNLQAWSLPMGMAGVETSNGLSLVFEN
jgi:ELWxxDGT repeat protein